MKKVIASITLLCYLAVTCGVIVNFHYCMNRLDSAQFFAAKSETCGKCGMHTEDSDGCCRDEVKIVKMEIDQKVASAVSSELPELAASTHLISQFIAVSFSYSGEQKLYSDHSPPLLTWQDTYLQNRVFRI